MGSVRHVALAVAFALAASGCVADDEDPGEPDGGPGSDSGSGASDAADGCAAIPALPPPWLDRYQSTIVGQLASSERSTVANRSSARNYLLGELTNLGYQAESQTYSTGTNPYARLDGDGDEVIVVGAHFDTVPDSPGANDNATGVAMVLAAARFLAEVDCRQRDVIFVLFDQEEIGLVGSAAFAQFLVNSGDNVVAVHTIDQMGWDQDGDRAIELERASANLAGIYAQARNAGGYDMPLQETGTGSTDHVSFRDQGYRAIGLTEEFVGGDTTPHYHLPSDTTGTVDFDYLASTSELFLVTVARVARGELAAFGPPVDGPARLRPTREHGGGHLDPDVELAAGIHH